jgi:hypothetical protein
MRGIMGKSTGRKDGGFVLVWALLLMVVLLILGISGIGTSVFESMMTANDALHKQAFYQADGGANVASMLIEENVSCPVGFAKNWDGGTHTMITPAVNQILVQTPILWSNPAFATPAAGVPSDANRDAFFFYNAADNAGTSILPTNLPRTNIKLGGVSVPLPGGPMEMAAGYEGKGKGLPGGGATINYDTFSQNINQRQTQSVVEILWQHIIGYEGMCKY